MRWAEFRQWAIDELGFEMVPTGYGGSRGRGGSQQMAQVLGLDRPGTGNHRQFGFREQQRLRTYVLCRRALGWDNTGHKVMPAWFWQVLDMVTLCPEGWIVVESYEEGDSIHFHGSDGFEHLPIVLGDWLRDRPPHTLLAIPVKGRE